MMHNIIKAMLAASLILLLIAASTTDRRYLFVAGAATFVLGVIAMATRRE